MSWIEAIDGADREYKEKFPNDGDYVRFDQFGRVQVDAYLTEEKLHHILSIMSNLNRKIKNDAED